MRIAGLPPVLTPALTPSMSQALLAALPKAEEAFGAGMGEAAASAVPQPVQTPAPPATSVQMLVTLAAAEPTQERRRREAAHADRGLSMLERLHAELVAGAVSPERLQEMVEWADTAEVPDDPQLASLAREIDVRVRVELAKLDIRA